MWHGARGWILRGGRMVEGFRVMAMRQNAFFVSGSDLFIFYSVVSHFLSHKFAFVVSSCKTLSLYL